MSQSQVYDKQTTNHFEKMNEQNALLPLHRELLKLVQMERRLNSKILTLLQQVEDDRS